MCGPADFNAQGLSDKPLEGCGLARGGPELELGVAARSNLQQRVLATIVQCDARQALRVTAVESFGQPQDRGKRANRPPALAGQVGVCVVPALWRGATMIAGDQGDGVDLLGLESAKVAVLDEVVRVLVMALVADMLADGVGQG